MNTKRMIGACVLSCLMSQSGFAQEKEIAITIDDLPFVGSANNNAGNLKREHDRFYKILNALVAHRVPATGFVIAGSIEKGQWELLEDFKTQNMVLGNHTYNHPNLNTNSAENYIANIDRADKKLQPLFTGIKYFRYPYLAEGKAEKRQQVYDYLSDHKYVIAPVTVDSKDYQFNAQLLSIPWRQRPNHLTSIKNRYLDYVWKQTLRAEAQVNKRSNNIKGSQILLIHANLLNSLFLEDLLQMYEKKGYRFVSLQEAMHSLAPIVTTPIEEGKPTEIETTID